MSLKASQAFCGGLKDLLLEILALERHGVELGGGLGQVAPSTGQIPPEPRDVFIAGGREMPQIHLLMCVIRKTAVW